MTQGKRSLQDIFTNLNSAKRAGDYYPCSTFNVIPHKTRHLTRPIHKIIASRKYPRSKPKFPQPKSLPSSSPHYRSHSIHHPYFSSSSGFVFGFGSGVGSGLGSGLGFGTPVVSYPPLGILTFVYLPLDPGNNKDVWNSLKVFLGVQICGGGDFVMLGMEWGSGTLGFLKGFYRL